MQSLGWCASLTDDLITNACNPSASIWGKVVMLNNRVQLLHGEFYSGGLYLSVLTVPMKDKLR